MKLSKIPKIIFLIFLGSILSIGFFFYKLSPKQRGVIFSEIFSSIPIVKNLATKTYTTPLNIEYSKEANELRSAFFSVDYILMARDKNGNEYIALYPFTVEAGFDLSDPNFTKEESIQQGEKVLNINLPSPKILSVDKKAGQSFEVIRNDIKNIDRDIHIKPVVMSFEKQAVDFALKSRILDNAIESAQKYFNSLWKGIYSKVLVNSNKYELPFREYPLTYLPYKLVINKNNFDFIFENKHTLDRIDSQFSNDKATVSIGYWKSYNGSYEELFESVFTTLNQDYDIFYRIFFHLQKNSI